MRRPCFRGILRTLSTCSTCKLSLGQHISCDCGPVLTKSLTSCPPRRNDDGLIDFGEFIEIDRRFPLVLFPAFRLQSQMQKQTLGESGWKHINEAVVKQQQRNAHMELHGGKEPPESMYEKYGKMFGFVNKRKVGVGTTTKSIRTPLTFTPPPSAHTYHYQHNHTIVRRSPIPLFVPIRKGPCG